MEVRWYYVHGSDYKKCLANNWYLILIFMLLNKKAILLKISQPYTAHILLVYILTNHLIGICGVHCRNE